MSGSSHAFVSLSRCVVSLDSGVSISWAPDENGSYEHGRLHHEHEEADFRSRIERARPAIEVVFDELEQAGRRFTAPDTPDFGQHRQGATHMSPATAEIVGVELHCKPALSGTDLDALAARISRIIENVRSR